MAESRLQRWARKKAEAGKQPEQSPSPVIESGPTPEEQQLAINEALPEHELLEKYGLPDPENIELGTDITGFMQKEIPEFLRRKALRGLWRSNPVLAVLDGLNDYDEDYTMASTAGQTVQSLYKVGQGMVDRTRKADEAVRKYVDDPAEPANIDDDPTIAKAPDPSPAAELENTHEEVELPDHQLAQNAGSQSEDIQEPRFRPRMRFDY